MPAARCPRCESVVALHEGRPFVTTHGTVELWHASCWDVRDTPRAIVVETFVEPIIARHVPPPRRFVARVVVGGVLAGSAVLGLAIVHHAAADAPVTTGVSFDVSGIGDESTLLRATSAEHEVVPPRPKRRDVADEFP